MVDTPAGANLVAPCGALQKCLLGRPLLCYLFRLDKDFFSPLFIRSELTFSELFIAFYALDASHVSTGLLNTSSLVGFKWWPP